MNQKAKMAGFHVLSWALFSALVAAFIRGFGQSFSQFWALPFFAFVLSYVALFYFNAQVLLPRFYLRKAYGAYVSAFVLLLLVFYFFRPFDRLVAHNNERPQNTRPPFDRPPSFDRQGPPPPLPLNRNEPLQNAGRDAQDLDIVSIVLFIAVWSASSVQQIIQQWRNSERRAIRAEADKVTAELLFLKAQINPHFLFNTLNNIYSLAIVKSDHTADAVLKLSSILRYVTDDVQQGFVPLQSEVECVRDYIELQKLRLNKKATVEFIAEGATGDKKIAPLLLMTFIENAFKYGISNHEACTITISIRSDEKNIHLYCRNRIFPREEAVEREGVGIGNARKRLDYLYPKNYLLNIDTTNDCFTVDLTLIA